MPLPSTLFGTDSTNPWWPVQKVGQDSVADLACEKIIDDLLHGKEPTETHIKAAGSTLANHFYFYLKEVGDNEQAVSMTPVVLWESQKKVWSDPEEEAEFYDVILDFSEKVLPGLAKRRKVGMSAECEYGPGTFIYDHEEVDALKLFEHLSQCGFAWSPDLQKRFDPLSEMDLFNEIVRLRKFGGTPNEDKMAQAFAQDMIRRAFPK